jgi:hypothetical protein
MVRTNTLMILITVLFLALHMVHDKARHRDILQITNTLTEIDNIHNETNRELAKIIKTLYQTNSARIEDN